MAKIVLQDAKHKYILDDSDPFKASILSKLIIISLYIVAALFTNTAINNIETIRKLGTTAL